MKTKQKDPTAETIKQPIGLIILSAGGFFLILVLGNTILPIPSGVYFCLSSLIGILGFTSYVWVRTSPSLYARFFFNIGFSSMFLLMGIRNFEYLFPQIAKLGIVGFICLVIFTHTLPMWNMKTANFIRNELYAPKTKIGKIIFRLSLLFIPVIWVVSAGVRSKNNDFVVSFILLIVSLLVAIIMPFIYRSPSSPWEHDLINKPE